MWVNRKDWEQRVIATALAKVDAQAEARLAELKAKSLEEKLEAAVTRIKELQGQLAEIGAQLATASSVITPPITEADWFEEDEDEVRKDRLRIQEEGADSLLTESD